MYEFAAKAKQQLNIKVEDDLDILYGVSSGNVEIKVKVQRMYII